MIDKWAIGQALNDLHFQTDSVRKCAAINDLLERGERDCFTIARLQNALEHYADSNHWACEVDDGDHAGRCVQKLYRGSVGNGYEFAQAAIRERGNENRN